MNNILRHALTKLVITGLLIVGVSTASAKTVTIKRGDTLYSIIVNNLGSQANMSQTMERVVKQNPKAFVNGDPASMVLGQRLKLDSNSKSKKRSSKSKKSQRSKSSKSKNSSRSSGSGTQSELKQTMIEIEALDKKNKRLKEQLSLLESEQDVRSKDIESLDKQINKLKAKAGQ